MIRHSFALRWYLVLSMVWQLHLDGYADQQLAEQVSVDQVDAEPPGRTKESLVLDSVAQPPVRPEPYSASARAAGTAPSSAGMSGKSRA
ncbi:hypothetical protein [Streptomyces sp. LUP30]|uniref:hypothetical protein n=1 Tax=Streptomyces sp. LUP30 TaxID=1890285 RepID=UPI000851BAB0|nr:hypothetical protein [Streptomyces sp. LUP30]